jgi:predicted ThiF/HesA family dinucleotide-utilizing enzyme
VLNRTPSTDSDIMKTGLVHRVGIVHVAQIDDDAAVHRGRQLGRRKGTELVPLGNQYQGVGFGRRVEGIAAIDDV